MIRHFEYRDLNDGWTLERFELREINLLVGISGVGKSRILRAFEEVRQAALRGADGVAPAVWDLRVGSPGGTGTFRWTAETSVFTLYSNLGARTPGERLSDGAFTRERIELGEQVVVDRTANDFEFAGRSLPRLDPAESAIALLSSEERIAPLHKSLVRWLFLDLPSPLFSIVSDLAGAEAARARYPDLETIGAAPIPSLLKLYILQTQHPEVFKEIVEQFSEVFPEVKEVAVRTLGELGRGLVPPALNSHLSLAIREHGVAAWIPSPSISTGMLKTLLILTELVIAPAGSVLFLDEIENSLGVNCLGEVTRILRRHAKRVQSVITSHHPYVINNIPIEYWKLVRRVDSTVSVIDAAQIPSLQTASPIERFTQLINAPEYEEGVA